MGLQIVVAVRNDLWQEPLKCINECLSSWKMEAWKVTEAGSTEGELRRTTGNRPNLGPIRCEPRVHTTHQRQAENPECTREPTCSPPFDKDPVPSEVDNSVQPTTGSLHGRRPLKKKEGRPRGDVSCEERRRSWSFPLTELESRRWESNPKLSMALPLSMLVLLLASVSLQACTAGRPLSSSSSSSSTNTFTPFQYSKFQKNFFVAWSESNVAAVDGGHTLQLSLNQKSGTAVSSTNKYLYGYFRASIKLVSGNSAGTVTAFYLSSQGHNHDEVDFEFLGNVTGEPYVLQTNVYAGGIGNREQRIYLWFDPRSEFHTYSVIWNHKSVSMYVDDVLIRVFQNNEAHGYPYLSKQPMGMYSSIFDASQWATRGGLVKIDFQHAPFLAHFSNFTVDACAVDTTASLQQITESPCSTLTSTNWWNAEWFRSIPASRVGQMHWVKKKFLVYDYCADRQRSPSVPFECTAPLL